MPSKEGVVLFTADDAFLWRTVPARTYSGIISSCATGCPKAEGSIAVTKDALIFIAGGKPIFKMKRSDMETIETEKYGRSRFLFITTPNYETVAIQLIGQEAMQPLVNFLGITWLDN